ncbi:isochorismatase family protein [Streptococcus dysgalactiae]
MQLFKGEVIEKGIDNLVMIGMLTNYCMDTTVRVAFELSYGVSVIEHGSTTFDDEDIQASLLIDYHESLWDGNFARVEPLDVILNEE